MSLEHDGSSVVLKIFPEPFRDFVSPRARKIIFWTVVSVHIAFIVLPLLWFSLLALLAPKPLKVLHVSLSAIPADWPLPSKHPSKLRPTPSDSVPDPGPLSPLPPLPDQKIEENAVAAKDARKQPVQKEVKETQAKSVDKKPSDKPSKKPSLEEQLKSSQKFVKNPPKKQVRGGGGLPDPDSIFRGVKTGTPAGGGGGPMGEIGDPNQNNAYFERLQGYIYNIWQPPGKALIGNGKPSVDVHISVAANGQIISASIVSRSGNQLVDASVERLLAEMKALPVPPKAMEFTMTLIIPDN